MSASAEGIRTTCPYCGVGCGILARRDPTGAIVVEGDPAHPANRGRLCSKGSALGATIGMGGRLLHARIGNDRVPLERALDHVAGELRRIMATHGPQAVALYVSGQLLTEDYYVANKLVKGYLGTANIDTNSRLCMSSAVAGHKRAFGEDIVPVSYDDFEQADLIVLVGANSAWCHPILFQRMRDAKRERPSKLVVLDPRRSATAQLADLHLPLRAGTDVWLFNGLLAYLHARGRTDTEFVARFTREAETALSVALESSGDPRTVAAICGVEESALLEFYELFAATERVITVFSQGVNQSSAGTDKVNSLLNCHLLTGRIGRPGMGPFSITGQPNAMGGREVGGLANTLAAHMDLDNPAHREAVQRFWSSPRIADRPGLTAVDLFDAIHRGEIRAVWIMATNPVVSLPDADKAREALRRCELVVVSDCVERTDTNACADVLLPAAAWGEKDGTVTNSERCISRQRAFLPLPGDAKPDWWLITEVARRLGHGAGFAFDSAREIFLEHAALSAEANEGTRAFDIGGLATLSRSQYDDFAPMRWPVPRRGGSGTLQPLTDGRFFHPDGRARFVATPPREPAHAASREFPLVLNTGRIRDQWHTMTRSAWAPQLTAHTPEPFVDMHAEDALSCGVRSGELARVETRWGSLIARVRTSGEMPRGMIFVPIHWSGEHASDARVGALVNPVVDPISGEPELKHTPARVAPFVVDWYGFVLSRRPLEVLDVAWWARVRGARFMRYEIAGRSPTVSAAWARALLHADGDIDWLEYSDAAAGIYRAAVLVDDRLDACVFVSSRSDLPARTWLSDLFSRERIDDADRAALLTGRPLDRARDAGPILCSCFGVGRETIVTAIAHDDLDSTQAIGRKLRAGTNCGSCLAEIRSLLQAAASR
jgi:assimilatory nitrate reductase catalytic subunit